MLVGNVIFWVWSDGGKGNHVNYTVTHLSNAGSPVQWIHEGRYKTLVFILFVNTGTGMSQDFAASCIYCNICICLIKNSLSCRGLSTNNRIDWVEWRELMHGIRVVFRIEQLVEITYSYWDGSGHRRVIEVPSCESRCLCVMLLFVRLIRCLDFLNLLQSKQSFNLFECSLVSYYSPFFSSHRDK